MPEIRLTDTQFYALGYLIETFVAQSTDPWMRRSILAKHLKKQGYSNRTYMSLVERTPALVSYSAQSELAFMPTAEGYRVFAREQTLREQK